MTGKKNYFFLKYLLIYARQRIKQFIADFGKSNFKKRFTYVRNERIKYRFFQSAMCLKLLLLFTFSTAIPAYSALNAQIVEQTDTLKAKKNNFTQKLLDYLDDSNKEKPDKKLDISFLGGPFYATETKLGIGLVASGLYRIDRSDKELSPSNISIYGTGTTSGLYGLGIRNNTIFPKDKYRIDADFGFDSYPTRYYGIGYEQGKQSNYSEYTLWEVYLNGKFLRRIANNIYLGFTTDIHSSDAGDIHDVSFFESRKLHNTSIGIGGIVSYDSRDFIPNPSKGVYLKIQFTNYPTGLGSTYSFRRTDFAIRHYRSLWNGGIVAFDIQGIFNSGNVPWSMMATLGDAFQMRGYYRGRYRDKKLLQAQTELRQKITGRHGAVVWVGAGNVFSRMGDLKGSQTLPNAGIGYRWEFKKRVNVRLDYGFGKGQSAFYFNINEAF